MNSWVIKIRTFLTALTNLLLVGRAAGWYQQENGPIVGQFTEKVPQQLVGFGHVKAAVKHKLIEAGLSNIQSRIDTPQERKVILSGIHVPGMSEQHAWLLSVGLGIADTFLEVLASSSPELLLSNWKLWLHGIAVALVGKLFLWLKQDSHNSTAVIKQQTFVDVAKLTEEVPQ